MAWVCLWCFSFERLSCVAGLRRVRAARDSLTQLRCTKFTILPQPYRVGAADYSFGRGAARESAAAGSLGGAKRARCFARNASSRRETASGRSCLVTW